MFELSSCQRPERQDERINMGSLGRTLSCLRRRKTRFEVNDCASLTARHGAEGQAAGHEGQLLTQC